MLLCVCLRILSTFSFKLSCCVRVIETNFTTNIAGNRRVVAVVVVPAAVVPAVVVPAVVVVVVPERKTQLRPRNKSSASGGRSVAAGRPQPL
jgi:hypothetical protein